MTKTRKTTRIGVVLILAIMMMLTFVPMTTLADGKLDTPEISFNHDYRSIWFAPVEGAVGYQVLAFDSFAAAETGTAPVATSVVITESSTLSTSAGGTTMVNAPQIPEGNIFIDTRLIQYTGTATRTLPTDFTPAGIGDSYFPGNAGTGNTTNLKPGQYWFRVLAVAADTANNSDLSAITVIGTKYKLPFTLAIGPDEGKALIEANLANLGKTYFIVDLRGSDPREIGDEGHIRYTTNTVPRIFANATDDELDAHIADFKAEVTDDLSATIMVYCRGGGRTVMFSQVLAAAGYTNVLNFEGINQWTHGLVYDHPQFRYRQSGTTTANYVEGVNLVGNELRWMNIPWAAYIVYAFEDELEDDPDKAVAKSATLAVSPRDISGSNALQNITRAYDLNNLDLEIGETYYIRLHAISTQNVPVAGASPAVNWGMSAVSLSEAKEYVPIETVFEDVQPSAWYYDAVMYMYDNDLMEGFPDGTFMPDDPLTRAQVVTILYRLADSPDVADLENPFSDVAAGQWWFDQIVWAADEDIVRGFPDGTFGGNISVTKAQLAALVYRWQIANDLIPDDVLEHEWPDAEDIEKLDWAAEEIATLTAQGLFKDVPGANFAPNTPASRAVVASVLYNLLTAIK